MNVSCAYTETKWLTQLDTKTSQANTDEVAVLLIRFFNSILSFLKMH